MIYSIQKYDNNFGLESPVLVVVTNISSSLNFPFIDKVSSANVSIYVDGVEIREKISEAINVSSQTMPSMMFDIQPIEQKYVDLSTTYETINEDSDVEIIALALKVNKELVVPANIG